MTDRELLERAAKAAGLRYTKPHPDYDGSLGLELCDRYGRGIRDWRPLTDDGDALRLAVKLSLLVDVCDKAVDAGPIPGIAHWASQPNEGDPYAATRRAIVRAAAAMAKEG